MSADLPRVVVVTGPTGTGKTELAIRLAQEASGEIVNFDSVQIFRGFDIGSAKPTTTQRETVPHHLFDVLDGAEAFDAGRFAALASNVCMEITAKGHLPILTGGTGFYLRAFLSGLPEMPPRNDAVRQRLCQIAAKESGLARLHRWLRRIDPATANRLAPEDRHRIERALEVWISSGRPISSWPAPGAHSPLLWDVIRFAINLPPDELAPRLDSRVEMMYQGGLVEEARALLAQYPPESHPLGSIGYREAVRHIQGELPLDEAIHETRRRTRAYAKRQRTWLRGEKDVVWIENRDPDESLALMLKELRRRWPDQ